MGSAEIPLPELATSWDRLGSTVLHDQAGDAPPGRLGNSGREREPTIQDFSLFSYFMSHLG